MPISLSGKIVPYGDFDMVDAKYVAGGASPSDKLGDDCLNLGITNGYLLVAKNTPVDNDFARFTATGLEGVAAESVAAAIGLGTSDSPTFANVYVQDDGKIGNADNYFQFHDDVNFVTLSAGSYLGLGVTPVVPLHIKSPGSIQLFLEDSNLNSGGMGFRTFTGGGSIIVDDASYFLRLGVAGGGTFDIEGNSSNSIFTAVDNNLVFQTKRVNDDLIFKVNNNESMRLDATNGNVGINDTNPLEKLSVNGNILISNGNELRLNDVGNSHHVGFEAPALTASQIWVLPATDGASGELLATDGAGVLSWVVRANISLSNLSSVAINTSLVSDTDSTDDLGTTTKKWRHLYIDITKAELGTAVAPSWCFDIDEGTGIYRWAESIIGFTCDGQYAMRIATGNVVVQNNLTIPDDLLNGIGGAVTVAEAQTAFDHTILTNNPHSTSIANLTDTTIASLLLNQSLMYNGSGWVNSFIPIESTFNGMFLETIDFTVLESAGVVTGSLEKENGGDLTQKFSDGYSTLDCTPAKTLVLTSFCGTDSIPKDTKVYILQSAKTTLVASNSGWPSTEHVRIANLFLRSPATTGTDDGALVLRNWNDHLSDSDNMGHIHHVEERLRQEPTQYASGIDLGLKNVAGAVMNIGDSSIKIEVTLTAGEVYQLHKQTYPAFDMYTTASDDVHVANQVANEGGSYQTTIDLVTDITVYNDGSAAGVTISNNRYFSIVIWGVQNRTGQASHVMINIPTGVDTIESSALADNNNYAVYTMATSFKGTGFLIARLVFKKLAGNEWEYIASSDLRGQTPITASATAIDTTHFLLVDGTRALQGAWDLGNNALTNVNIDSGDIANAVTNSEWDAAYTHSQDNTQAHSDYLINNGDDTTSGILQAAGYQIESVDNYLKLISTELHLKGNVKITLDTPLFLLDVQDNSVTYDGFTFAVEGAITATSNILVSNGNELRLNDVGNSHYVGFEAPALTASQIWVLPATDGASGEVLVTDGLGTLSWSEVQAQSDVLDDLNIVGVVGADSELLVGTGVGVFAWESGTTLRTSLGLGITDTVTFVDIITKGPWVDIRAFGAVGDGATDDKAAIQAAIDSVSSDSLIYIPEGIFLVNSAITIGKSLTIIGNGKASVIKVGFAGYAFIVSTCTNLVLQDFVIDGNSTGTGFSIATSIELLRVEKVTFNGCASDYCINAGSTRDIDRIEIIGCTVKNCLNGIRLAGECVSAYVGHNLIDTLTGTVEVIGFQLGHNTYAMQDNMLRYIVEGNIFLDITTTGVNAEAHAILAYGREIIIRNNIIRTVTNHASSTQGAEAIYTKARFTTISGNTIVDGGSSNNGVIAVKGVERDSTSSPQGFATFVTDNILIESAVTTDIGIWIGSDDVLVARNYFENLSGSAIRTQVAELDNISILNNIVIKHQGTRAIRTSHYGAGLRINDNYIWEMSVFGIVVEARNFLTDVEINNNHIGGSSADASVRYGIFIDSINASGRYKGLQIIGNHISLIHTVENAFGIFIDVTAADDVAIDKLIMRDNDCSRLSGHDIPGTIPLSFDGTCELKISDFIIRDNFFLGSYQAKTAGFNVEFEHSGDLFTNNGAGGTITGILPVAQPGLIYSFAAVDDNDLRIDPDGTDAIIGGSGAGKYISLDTLGDTITLECAVANEWIIKSGYGTYATE